MAHVRQEFTLEFVAFNDRVLGLLALGDVGDVHQQLFLVAGQQRQADLAVECFTSCIGVYPIELGVTTVDSVHDHFNCFLARLASIRLMGGAQLSGADLEQVCTGHTEHGFSVAVGVCPFVGLVIEHQDGIRSVGDQRFEALALFSGLIEQLGVFDRRGKLDSQGVHCVGVYFGEAADIFVLDVEHTDGLAAGYQRYSQLRAGVWQQGIRHEVFSLGYICFQGGHPVPESIGNQGLFCIY